jgi:Flp pilus assembly protein TadB
MTALLVACLTGLGLVLLVDGLTRPASRPFGVEPGGLAGLLAGTVVGLLAGLGVWLLTGWPVLILAAVIGGFLAPRAWFSRGDLQAQAARSEAVAELAAGLRDAVRGGLGVTEAIGGLAAWGPPALRRELSELAAEASALGLPEALGNFARRLGDPLADLLATTLALNHRLGGRNLAEVLDDLAAAIRAEAQTLREMRARQAQQRLSAKLVAAAPFAILLLIRQANPDYLTPFRSAIGQGVLGLAVLLVVAGYAAMVVLARPPADTRLLPPGSGTASTPTSGGAPR